MIPFPFREMAPVAPCAGARSSVELTCHLARSAVAALLFASAFVGFAGCKRTTPALSDASPPAASSDLQSVTTDDAPAIYGDAGPVDPLASRLCVALLERAHVRRAECAGTKAGISFAGVCASALTSSMRSGGLVIERSAVDACAAAVEGQLRDCNKLGLLDPQPPPECQDLARGLRTEGATCRSSLECAGTLRCRGVSPTSVGTCTRALPDGAACGLAMDPLAAYTRQETDRSHPECLGFCSDHRCAPRAARGGACRATIGCGAADVCVGGHCVAREGGN
jgi:hypothetical protein